MKSINPLTQQITHPIVHYKIYFGDTHCKQNPTNIIRKQENYLDVQLPEVASPSKQNLLAQFNHRLSKCIKKREVNVMLKSNSRHKSGKSLTQLSEQSQKKEKKKLIIIDEEQIIQKGQSLDLRNYQKSINKRKKSQLKSLSSDKKNIPRISIIKNISPHKIQKKSNSKQQQQDIEKRSKLIKNILKRCHLNRQSILHGEQMLKNCFGIELEEKKPSIIRLMPSQNNEQVGNKSPLLKYMVGKINNQKYPYESKGRKRENSFFRQKNEKNYNQSHSEQQSPVKKNVFECFDNRFSNIKSVKQTNKLAYNEQISPWSNDFS